MRLLIRLAGDTGAPLDLHVELAEDVTVGELADHLRTRVVPGGGTDPTGPTDQGDEGTRLTLAVVEGTSTRPLLHAQPVAVAGPRSGSTVVLATSAAGGDDTAAPAPVEFAVPGSPAIPLRYGHNAIGGAVLVVRDRVTLRSGGVDVPTVNGERVLGETPLRPGDLVRIGGRTGALVEHGPLRPPSEGTHHRVQVAPERRRTRAPTTVEVPTPPVAQRTPGFPVLSATVPLLMGAALWAVTRSAASVAFVVFSFVFVVASAVETRREHRAEMRFREREFREVLESRVDRARGLREDERRWSDDANPSGATACRLAQTRGRRIWERLLVTPDSGALRVRIGTAMLEPADALTLPTSGRTDLLEEARAAVAGLTRSSLPVVVDLDERGGLAIVGRADLTRAAMRSTLVQLAALAGPDVWSLRVLAAADRVVDWTWCEWLPHHRCANALRSVVVVDGADPAQVSNLLDELGAQRSLVLWRAADDTGLPLGVRAVLTVDAGGDGGHAVDGPGAVSGAVGRLDLLDAGGASVRRVDGVELDLLDDAATLGAARALAHLVAAPRLRVGAGSANDTHEASPPERVLLSELLGERDRPIDGARVRDRWNRTEADVALSAAIGRCAAGDLVIDLRADGPHALVAGTTGAGKSELLRTLVAALAANHSPERLTFLLVDYKGGAAFGPLGSLPHTVGVITDLDDGLAARALRSLRAEVRRREELLAGHGVSDLIELDAAGTPDRPPALAVVVDEFAALARELPDFVEGLVDVAQRGRSLGLHLVLATQRPAGVVTDSIRANTSLRIALRVSDEDDSLDVVDVGDAAHLPRDLPGRAVVRVGPRRHTRAQIAWSGSSRATDERVRSWPFGAEPGPPRRPSDEPVTDDLSAVVAAARSAAVLVRSAPPRRPWLDPLPDHLDLDDLHLDYLRSDHPRNEREPSEDGGPVGLGWIDRPDLQRRDLLQVDLDRDGGVLVVGAAGSGRSTALRTFAHATLRRFAPGGVQVHGIDAGRGLRPLLGLDGVADVVPAHDAERVLRLLRAVARDLAHRMDAPWSNRPTRIVIVDGFGELEELHERVNRAEAIDLLTRVIRDGRAVGIHVALSARRRSEAPPTIVASLGCRIFLRCATEDDAVLAGLPEHLASTDLPPGRGSVGGELVQIANAPAGRGGAPAEPVPTLPRQVHVGSLRAEPCSSWALPIGIDADTLEVARLDLTHRHAIVAGAPRSGVSTSLATLAVSVERGYLVAARPSAGGPWQLACTPGNAIGDLFATALASARSGRRTLIAVDDFAEVVESPAGALLEARLAEVLSEGAELPLRIVAGGEVDAMTRCYSDALVRLRSSRTGLLLQSDPDLHAAWLHASLPPRNELPSCAGRGWAVAPGSAQAVQVAQPVDAERREG